MTRELLASVTWWGVMLCFVYLVAVQGLSVMMYAVAARENRLRAREDRLEDYLTLRTSPFTIPVSVVAPAFNEEAGIVPTARSLLAQNYPGFEVIVVSDGSTDGTIARLAEAFDLELTGTFYQRVVPSSDIRAMYRSRRDPRLTVVDMHHGGKAWALNCGLNLARYRYVCTVDGDTVYHADALLKGMRLPVHDPATVIGVTSRIEVSARPEEAATGHPRGDRRLLVVYQLFDYLRAFMGTRLGWSRGNYMLCASGAFAIWRRDVVLGLGGFSKDFTCEDIEFTFRVHEHFRARGLPYRIHSMPDAVAFTEGPESIGGLVKQRARWQRVIMETVWHYRHMLCNPRYGTVGWLGMPYYLLGEVIAPVMQLLAVLLVPVAVAAGLLNLADFLRLLGVIALTSGAFTAAALFFQRRTMRPIPARYLPYMLLLAPFDLFLYRPIIAWAQCKGVIGFFRGQRDWDKSARNVRS